MRAPALREERLVASPEALVLARRLEAGEVDLVVLLTGVGTRALAAALGEAGPRPGVLLGRTRIVARGPKPLAALRELGVAGAHPVPEPFTWRQVLEVVDGLGVPQGGLAAVQEYGAPVPALVDGLVHRGLRVLSVPVYRWADLSAAKRSRRTASRRTWRRHRPRWGRWWRSWRPARATWSPPSGGLGRREVTVARRRHVCDARAPPCWGALRLAHPLRTASAWVEVIHPMVEGAGELAGA